MGFLHELTIAARSLSRSKGLALTVVLTLALGIGANAAIFSVVRGVLLRPLVNRDEDRLIYIRQTALGLGTDNAAFSVPEIQDLRGRITTLSAFGDSSTVGFTMMIAGFALARITASYVQTVELPGIVPLAGAAFVLLAAAILASVLPASRAARVDVIQALRSD